MTAGRLFKAALANTCCSVALSLSAVLFVACGGGGGDTPPTAVVPAGFAYALSQNALSVTAGLTGSVSATISRTGSFAGTVSLAAEAVPNGITIAFSPVDIAAGTTLATISVSAATTVTPGTYSFTVRGKASGLADQTGTVSLTIVAAPAFLLSLSPSSLSLQAGTGNVATSVLLARTNFSDVVTLSVEGLPAGVTATLSTTSPAADSTLLTLSALTTTAAGTYPIVMRAKSALVDRTATLSLTVTAPQDFALSAAPASLSVVQLGPSVTTTVNIARLAGFTGAVALSLENLPTGVTGAFAASSVTGASTVLTLNAAAGATVGTSTVTVRGKVAGLPDRTTTLSVVVAASGAFTLSLTPPSLTVPQGQSASSTATIVRVAPFTGPITLAVTGLPTGITAVTPTIAAGATTAVITLSASANAAAVTSSLIVHATAAGVAEQTASLSITVSTAQTSLISQHVLVQEGFAIALASTVLQSQIQVLIAVTTTGAGSATTCETLSGGGSVQSLPVGADNPKKVGIYYDNACVKPYILADATQVTNNSTTGRSDITESATYFAPAGTLLGSMALQEHATFTGDNVTVAGLGTFTPANGATAVKLGLACAFTSNTNATYPCYGGVTQNVPSLALALGSVTVLNLHVVDANSPVTFDGSNSVLTTGALNALTLSAPTELTLGIAGGATWGSSSQSGSAATFSLFPPTPTGWTVTDTGHDMKFSIQVVSNATRNLTGSVTQISTGVTLATFALDQSGTGTVTYSDGTMAAVTSWLFAN